MKINIGLIFIFITVFFFSSNINAQQVSFEFDTVCEDKITHLKAIADLLESDIVSYNWDFENNGSFDSTGKEIEYTNQTNNTIKLEIRTTNNVFSYINQVIFHKTPLSLFALPNSCEGDTFIYLNYSFSSEGDIIKYEWDFNSDGIIDSQDAGDATYIFDNAGIYKSTLTVETEFGCVAFFSNNVTVLYKPNAQFNILNNCIGDKTILENTSSYHLDSINQMIWDFGDGYSIATISDCVSYQYNSVETYPMSLQIRYLNGCIDKYDTAITTNPPLDFMLLFSPDTVIYGTKPVQVELKYTYDSVLWSNGEIETQITISDSGLYSVRVVKNGCIHTQSFQIIKKENVPTLGFESSILTLNGDGINDELLIKDFGAYGSCNISIYNSRGVLIYSNKAYENDWNLTINGEMLETGGYFYIAETESGTFRGSFSILR